MRQCKPPEAFWEVPVFKTERAS